MKINNKEKINEYFREIRTDTVFQALKSQKYVGIRRDDIDRLLSKYSLNQVFSYLKTKYRKTNFLLIYTIAALVLFFAISGLFLFFFLFKDKNLFLEYLNTSNFLNLAIIDYAIFSAIGLLAIFLLLIIYELFIRLRKL